MRKFPKLLLVIGLLVLITSACMTLDSGDAPAGEPSEEEPSEVEGSALPPEPTMALMPTRTMAAMPEATMEAMPTPTIVDDSPPGMGGDPEPTYGPDEPETVYIDLNTIFGEVVEGLPEGSALFNPAENMRLGKVYEVEVRISPVTADEIEQDEEIIATLTVGMPDEQPVVVIPLKVSTVMEARLTGEAFTITPLTKEEQIRTSEKPFASWKWEVRPERSGLQRLTLHLSVVVNAEGMGDKTHTVSDVRVVDISPNLLYLVGRFMGSNWEWVATGVVLPFLGWGVGKIRGRRKGMVNRLAEITKL